MIYEAISEIHHFVDCCYSEVLNWEIPIKTRFYYSSLTWLSCLLFSYYGYNVITVVRPWWMWGYLGFNTNTVVKLWLFSKTMVNVCINSMFMYMYLLFFIDCGTSWLWSWQSLYRTRILPKGTVSFRCVIKSGKSRFKNMMGDVLKVYFLIFPQLYENFLSDFEHRWDACLARPVSAH